MQKPCTYACRRGKGQFAALGTAQRFACGNEWFLQMDVRKYFDSIPKALMLERLGRVFAEGLRWGTYLRYMDDSIAWSNDRARVISVRDTVGDALAGLGLEFKREPVLNRSSHGVDFLGQSQLLRGFDALAKACHKLR